MNSSKWITALKMLVLAAGLIALYGLMNRGGGFADTSGGIAEDSGDVSTSYDFAMGTSVSLSLYGGNSDLAETIMDGIHYLDVSVISRREAGSELYNLNNGYTPLESYEVSSELYTAIAESLSVCRDSGGALDITIRPLADVWNIEEADSESFKVPEESDIQESLLMVGYEHLSASDLSDTLSTEGDGVVPGGTLCIDAENITVDLGAVGKGYALDYVKGILDTGNLKGAVVAVGGSVMVYGSKTDGSDFRVGIRNPEGAIDEMTGYLSFPGGSNICISTSGNYEKYFVVDGVRYHHILDRTTGYPAKSGLASVTVVCENGLYSDALSTACFVLGYEASLPLLEKYNAEAVFIDDDNGITVTEGLAGIYHDAD